MGILDKDFKYTPSATTDIRKTFAREHKRLKDEAAALKVAQEADDAEALVKVKPLIRAKV